MKIKTIFIVGPTASGKTALSIELAKRFHGEIISADSMQIYKGIHIASAAPDFDEMDGIKHHLIEFLNTGDTFSVADYKQKAMDSIKDVKIRNKTPFVVGGTGLYVNSLLDNIEYIENDVDEDLRQRLSNQFDEIGGENMLLKLSSFDEETANRLHPNNKRRIIRAFEVFETTGRTLTEQNLLSKRNKSPLDSLIIGITYKNRDLLYNRINKRVDIMMENGLLVEAEKMYKTSNSKGAFQAIGHKELYEYFNSSVTLDEAIENLKAKTRQYAKRQLTWFRKNENINWAYPDECDDILEKSSDMVQKFLGGE